MEHLFSCGDLVIGLYYPCVREQIRSLPDTPLTLRTCALYTDILLDRTRHHDNLSRKRLHQNSNYSQQNSCEALASPTWRT